jgi:hypothetical protein
MKMTYCGWLVASWFLVGCGPSEQPKAQRSEERRIECLDKFCEGDVEPKHDPLREVALKLNGQWFIGPREYFSTGINGAAFYWPSKTPSAPGDRAFPERSLVEAGKGDQASIVIFLTGRQRWPTPNVEKPWDNSSWDRHFGELQAQGLRMERTTLNAGLDLVRFRKLDGKPYNYSYYIATGQQRIRGSGPPVLSCQESTPPYPRDVCTSGEFWQPDVYADFRFNIKHAPEWPAIHEEIVRVLNLSRKVQP